MVLTVKSGSSLRPEPEVRKDARDHDDEHEIGHQRTVPKRPFGEVEALHQTAPRTRTFWPGRSTWTPAVTTTSPVSNPCDITTVAGSYRRDVHLSQGHSLALRIDHPHGRMSVCLGECTRRDLHAGGCGQLDAAGDSGPQLHGLGRIDDADLDLERSGGGIRLGRHLPHAAGGPHGRVVGEGDLHQRIARTRPNELLGHVEDGVASALTRELHDHLPGMDHFARLGADRGDRTRGIGGQDRVAQLFLRGTHLCLSGVDLGLDGLELLLRFVEIGSGRPPIFHEFLLPPESEARLCQHRLNRCQVGLRRVQPVLLDLGVELSDDLACREHIADIDEPLDHPSVEAKGKVGLVLGADVARQRNGLAFRDALDGDRPDGPGLGGGWCWLVAARDGPDDQSGAQNLRLEHWCCLSEEGEALQA